MSVATRTNNTPGYLLLCGAILTIIAVSGFGHSINAEFNLQMQQNSD